ncbi:family 20 glycosylhydrolase [Flammeovirga sp. MY04]|uniref:glycoside hydrolase family 20 protein n=1 Tax=Flammeovirga sp. MY04 TaxID=1191459 RepID=UPI000806161E|nr:family 20 glycosylhydrolase [Flammeovirga sp. MY04]ANQ52815.1 family 20 glycosylhydrolase [Flammeovirga sp. MY04]
MRRITLFLGIMMLFLSFACTKKQTDKKVNIIPAPLSIQYQEDFFKLTPQSVISASPDLNNEAILLQGFIQSTLGFSPQLQTDNGNIELKINTDLKEEEYLLSISNDKVSIEGKDGRSVLWGIQSLRQIISKNEDRLPCVTIKDQPRFKYRGMHLDVGRHIFPVAFIKKYIDILSLHKINTFHWHLTEDQGWRIEIKKYPKLTEIGGFRKGTVVGHHGSSKQFDGQRYGGFYTQEEVKEVVKYAQERGIETIPEIELPGHALAALASYPQFGCSGGPYEVAQTFGVFEEVYCAGNEDTFHFLEEVLDEVMPLFPSNYIHIGGDECPKTQWKKCPKCQKRIRDEKLKDEHELQSYFVQRIEKYLNSKGKRMIGWDEILEGGLAPNATVMSWRGTEGGIAAAKAHHEVIMTPGDHVYFDHYQTEDISNEPLQVGGYTSVKEVYDYEPLPSSLSKEEQKYIIGVQGNVWTEYMKTPEKVEYMMVPRVAALSEIAWTAPDQKDWTNFKSRLNDIRKVYDQMHINYAKHLYNVLGEVKADTTLKALVATLETTSDQPILYTLDGTVPNENSKVYAKPIVINQTTTLNATVVPNTSYLKREINFHKAAFKPLKLLSTTSNSYFKYGRTPLNDGLRGSLIYNSGAWVGFNQGDFSCVIDLEKETEISKVEIGTLIKMKKGVFGPKSIEIYISDDQKDYQKVGEKALPITTKETADGISDYEVTFDKTASRYIKVIVRNYGKLPQWHNDSGKQAYVFIDEIIVE